MPIAQQSKGSLSRAVSLRHMYRVWQLQHPIARREKEGVVLMPTKQLNEGITNSG